MNYSLLKSRTFWTIVFAFVFNGYTAISGQLPPNVTMIVDAVLAILQTYFHKAGVVSAANQSAALGVSSSGQ